MAVIARRGAEETHPFLLRPRAGRMRQAVRVCLGNQIIHQIQAGVAADQNLLRLRTQQRGKELFCGWNARQLAVVAHVDALVHAVVGFVQNRQQIAHKIELFPPGLTARHVQREMQRFQSLIFAH